MSEDGGGEVPMAASPRKFRQRRDAINHMAGRVKKKKLPVAAQIRRLEI